MDKKRNEMMNLSIACSIFQFREFSNTEILIDATLRVTGIISRRAISSTRTRQKIFPQNFRGAHFV
jgi:hypothetical protein